MDDDDAGYNEKHRVFQASAESDHERNKKYHDAQGVTTFDDAGDVGSIENVFDRCLSRMRLDLSVISDGVRKPFDLYGHDFSKVIYFEGRFVE